MLLEEAGVEPVRELGMILRFTCGKLVLGLSQLCKNKDVVFTSRHASSVILEQGLFKTSQMNELVFI